MNQEKLISSTVFHLSKGVNGRVLKNQEGKLELAIIINDNTSADELRKAWRAIDNVRTRLREFKAQICRISTTL